MDIYGTIGPACADRRLLTEMFRMGMTGIRLNLSHTELAACQQWTNWIKEAAQAAGIMPKLLIDLQGPELRIGELERPLQLKEGNEILLKPLTSNKIAGRAKDTNIQDDSRSMIPVPEILWPALRQGQQILLDDGKILLAVAQSNGSQVYCKIQRGGLLSSRKSIALSKTEMKLPTLTESDHKNIQEAKKHGITGVMLPFVRRAQDLKNLRQELENAGVSELKVFAKIENLEGVRNLNDLLPYADHIVIARGDLGNRMPLWELPVIQAKIAAICKEAGKPFMVVTQMLASMEKNKVPTRAEVSDIFRAVSEGAASVMVTGETAAGSYPLEVIRYLCRTVESAQDYLGQG